MRLFLMTSLTMVAFAANSLLNRWALAEGAIGAWSFGGLRLVSGALMLAVLVAWSGGETRLRAPGRWVGVASLLAYIFGFSAAYLALDAGLGALILFGTVQITMFAGAMLAGERPTARRSIGAAIAFGGLCWLLWPGGSVSPSPAHAAAMALAGLGWGIYSLAGRREDDATMATAANFILAAPVGLALALAATTFEPLPSARGLGLAVVSGAVTSALGYVLWYRVLPRIPGSTAAVAQLTVPVIAIVGGAVLLSEPVDADLLTAACLVLGGVLLAVTGRRG